MFESNRKTRTWGFRFSLMDAVAIGVFMSAAGVLWHLNSPLWWMLLIAAGHFFLFCNVFRIVRRRELIWAGLFILNVGIWAWFDHLTWPCVLLCQLPITAALIVADMRAPGYHGIFASRLNPRLNDYLEGRIL
ncbi:MAG TPA: hypothetical protein VK327_14830 [Candidatus Paceibacterota bacterium]|nr:hypothetical protein [Candidatus Paceibacterota bacterium]